MKSKNKRLIFIASIFSISLLTVFFIIDNFRSNIVFFYSPSEIMPEKNHGKTIRVGGLVKEKSLIKISNLEIEFVVTDLKNDLKINYRGITPNLFREGQGVIAKGIFNVKENKFIAKELLVKHDEKYMPPEVKKSLEKAKK